MMIQKNIKDSKRRVKVLLGTVLSFILLTLSQVSAAPVDVEFDVNGNVYNLSISEEGILESITVDENDYLFADDVGFVHYIKESVTVDDLNVGDEVGLVIDPSNIIVELWILKDGSQELMDKSEEISEESDPFHNQPNGSGEIRLENGVWRN